MPPSRRRSDDKSRHSSGGRIQARRTADGIPISRHRDRVDQVYYRASRYSRYERSRSRERGSPDRYDRTPQYAEGDRRRSSAEVRSNTTAFQSNRESFGDPLRRDPPRGPKALLDAPNGPRGGGYAGDFRGGRGRGRGRGWSTREESRDRGRDRDIDYRDRYRDDRSREHERDRDRERDWRDSREFRLRRSPVRRPRSPPRGFRDREVDGPLGVDADRSRRGSRDGGPLSAGSTSSDPFGTAPFARGGGFHRGRGRGRGDWSADRGRGRASFVDDRNDRYPRSRSQEGRWARDRDERDQMDRQDRYADAEPRHLREERDPRDRELFRSKMEARTSFSHDSAPMSPPIAPSAPAFGTVPNRPPGMSEGYVPASAAGKAPPTAPRAFNDRPVTAGQPGGHDGPTPPAGPAKQSIHDSPPIPVGPRAQQQKPQRPSSKQWINPNIRKTPDSPKLIRAQAFLPQRPPPAFYQDQHPDDDLRPRSSDAKSDSHLSGADNRARSNYSAEPGEITVKSERESQSAMASADQNMRPPQAPRDVYRSTPRPSPTMEYAPKFQEQHYQLSQGHRRRSKRVRFVAEQVEVPPKRPPPEHISESDDDDDMADYFAMEIQKTEVELSKLEKPKLPMEVVRRYASLSHGAMVQILSESEGLMDMMASIPEHVEPLEKIEAVVTVAQSPNEDVEMTDAAGTVEVSTETLKEKAQNEAEEKEKEKQEGKELKEEKEEKATGTDVLLTPTVEADEDIQKVVKQLEAVPKNEEMEVDVASADVASLTPAQKPPVREIPQVVETLEVVECAEGTIATDVAKGDEVSDATAGPKDVEAGEVAEAAKVVEAKVVEAKVVEASEVSKIAEGDEAAKAVEATGVADVAQVSEAAHVSEVAEVVEVATVADVPNVPDVPDVPGVAEVADAIPGDGRQVSKVVGSGEAEPPAAQGFTEALAMSITASLPLEITERGSNPPSTPSQVPDDDATESDEDFYMNVDNVRQYNVTPSFESLPDFSCTPWHQDRDLLESFDMDSIIESGVLEHIQRLDLKKTTEQEIERKVYTDKYAHYLQFTMSNDPVAVKSRGKFAGSTGAVDRTGSTTPEHRHEGSGRGRRFATERDLERVLQASMREDEERKEREMRMQKEKYRSEKEAIIPDMIWTQEEKDDIYWIDESGFTPQERLVSAWRVLPPIDNFTELEAEQFEKRYLEAPKQWGKVADGVPHRDFGTCIQYYYMKKKEIHLKEKLKKQPKRRRKGGRGKQRSSALVSEFGNPEGETEDHHETGENGERRRPRRAAAPTWGYEQQQQQADTENSTPSGTPGRRGGSAAAKGDQPEKVDGRKGRRKAKDKEPKAPRGTQTLAAAPAPGRGRSRSNSRAQNVEFQPPVPSEIHRLPTQFEQMPSGIQPPFTVQQPQPMPTMDRPQPIAPSSISEVMAAPSLRPDPPPPQHAMSTFNLAQPQPERKAPTQASSYWSVSESNDFPHLLASFGSDWTAIAAHMGSKTAVMVKNYFVRQKDSGKAEWEAIVQEADGKRMRGEGRPEPPQPSTGGRGRRYDNAVVPTSRPLAVATGLDLRADATQPKLEAAGQGPRAQPFSNYGVPIAQAPVQQQLVHPPQQGLAMQQHPAPHPTAHPTTAHPTSHPAAHPAAHPTTHPAAAHPATHPAAHPTAHTASHPVSQAMSPVPRTLRAPFSFPEREREPGQRVPLPQKAPATQHVIESREQAPHAGKMPIMPNRAEPLMAPKGPQDTQKLEMQLREQQQQQQHIQREKERELSRQTEMQTMRVKMEPDTGVQQHHYEPFGHRSHPSQGQPLARPPQDAGRPQSYPPPAQPPPSSQPMRSMLSDQPPARSPQMAAPQSRPVSTLQSRPSSGSMSEPYRASTPQAAPPAPAPVPAPAQAPPRPPEPRKTSNIMSLLNDDNETPPPKRVSDVASAPARPSPTPPPGPGRSLAGPPPSHLRREQEQYSPYGRAPSGGASAMPALKPAFSDSSQAQHMGVSRAVIPTPLDMLHTDVDVYRVRGYQSGQQSSQTNSPQAPHRYPPPGPPSQAPYQSQGGYPTHYSAGQQATHSSSPASQYALHPSASRAREVPQGGRESSWPPASHQPPSSLQQSSGWAPPGSNTSQPPQTHQQSWSSQHPVTKPQTPAPSWSPAPPPPSQPPHHMSMRDDPRGPAYYGASGSGLAPQQHQMQGRYAPPPSSRGPEPVPPPAQAYRGYAATPGSVQPRDPREMPSRSYTPVGYDSRGPPPPPGSGYPGPDPREAQMRDNRDPRDPRDPRDSRDPRDPRDPREMMARGLRPHEYDRHPDQYRR